MSSKENYYSKGARTRLGCHSLRGNGDKENVIKLVVSWILSRTPTE